MTKRVSSQVGKYHACQVYLEGFISQRDIVYFFGGYSECSVGKGITQLPIGHIRTKATIASLSVSLSSLVSGRHRIARTVGIA